MPCRAIAGPVPQAHRRVTRSARRYHWRPMIASRLNRLSRRFVGAWLLALLFAQWATLAHAIAHAPARAAVVAGAAADDAWDHAAGAPACLLLDHLLIGQAPGGVAATLPALPAETAGPVGPAAGRAPGAPAPVYDARGPPGC